MAFGLLLSALSVVVMLVFTTPLAALLSTLGIVYYALFYTRWLKRSTWQNIVIGGERGSLPPLVGWTAVTGSLNLAAVVLFAIIFYWTPPHFWALALVKQKDYTRAGVPMLPVVAGEAGQWNDRQQSEPGIFVDWLIIIKTLKVQTYKLSFTTRCI
ncbi:protoheme IX farnesyltransferase, partial [Nostoc sp. HG1]|nr:protoheme IX farnesyltransferase [Nostoc sp. HG1]